MKRITINKKEYKFEFSIEASLYDDCTKSVMDMLINAGKVQGAAESDDVDNALESIIDSIAEIPQKAVTLFYAGLLEHHGAEGDGSIQSISDAKRLLAQYIKESEKSFKDVFEEMIELMADDSFFDLIGLTQMTKEMTAELNAEQPVKKVGKGSSEKN